MNSICVFCGSSTGIHPAYADAAADLGRHLSARNIRLIYGGGNVGLMGILADAVIGSGGTAIGVIPRSIADMELAHGGLSALHYVDSMQERKDKMASLSDAFIAMPGGFGTLDELFEVLTHNQLRLFDKPVGILNVNGYFDGLLAFLDHCVEEQFVRPEHRNNIFVSDRIPELVDLLNGFEPVSIGKWIAEIREESVIKGLINKK